MVLSSLLCLTLLATTPLFAAAYDSNVLLTGESIPTDSQLIYKDTTFIIQDDCNLVLYNHANGFQSNTHGEGKKCSLTVDNLGHLVIKSMVGSVVWTSPTMTTTKAGKYAAVLRPDGQVAVYGPSLWSTPMQKSTAPSEEIVASGAGLIPAVRNLLFASQVLYNNATLETRDYSLGLQEDCELALVKAGVGTTWAAGTAGKGQGCFVRVNHFGQVSVVDDKYKVLWGSQPVGKVQGDYVLVLESHGQAEVYGPVVWSTAN